MSAAPVLVVTCEPDPSGVPVVKVRIVRVDAETEKVVRPRAGPKTLKEAHEAVQRLRR